MERSIEQNGAISASREFSTHASYTVINQLVRYDSTVALYKSICRPKRNKTTTTAQHLKIFEDSDFCRTNELVLLEQHDFESLLD